MADVNANIGVQIDTSDALAQLKNLQRQLSQFHTSVAKSSSVAAAAQKSLQKNLVNSINSIGAFSAELRTVKTSAESFTNSLEKNKFSMREYFRYAGASTKTFGRMFTAELDTISKVAEDRVKKLQTQYIKLGRDSQGAMKAIAVMPNQLDFSKTSTQLQIAAQKQAIFNQLLKQGSTNLLNFGKNTQWAGRQLMVGFTVPLGILGMKASQTFMDMEKAALKFKKVYGDLLTSPEETKAALDGITELGKQYTKYGVAVADTVSLSAEAAAAGFQGLDLQRQTAQATRLSVLGQIEAQQALETTIALQNAFKMSSEDLAGSIDFLNAVENQTVTSLDDITIAIPKVAPVIRQLGGDVKDLAFFITAMKQGGINASEGANALKSGLAALINPTSKATAMLADMGININKIVESNQGDIKGTVIGFAEALDTLDPLNRARAIEQMFGKFQFARLSALFSNVIADGTQASRVLDLAGSSIEDLAALSEKELGMTAASPMNQFKKAVEDLKLALVPVGETFLKAVTPIVEFFGNILSKFSGLSENTKKIITIITIALAGVGPVLLMTFGLLANGVANIIKLFATLRTGYLKLTGQSTSLGEQTQYMTTEQLEAAAAAHSLNQSHATLKQTFDVEKASLDQLIASYQSAAIASAKFAASNPGAMLPIPGGKRAKKYAKGKPYVVGGSGNKDSEPAMLAPGETVIPAAMSKKYGGLINGIIAGNIPGYETGRFTTNTQTSAVASHFDITAPSELSKTISMVSKELGDFKVGVFRLTKNLETGGHDVTRTLENLADIGSESNIDVLSGGRSFAGTTTLGQGSRNQMFNALGIKGEAFTLDSLIEQGNVAEEAIKNNSVNVDKYSEELNILIDESKKASELLATAENPTREQIKYMDRNAKQALTEATLADARLKINGRQITLQEAENIADQKLLQTRQELAALETAGVKKETLLQKAKEKYIATMLKSGTGEVAVGATGTGGNVLRDVATGRGRDSLRRADRVAGERKFAYGGRGAAEIRTKVAKSLSQGGQDLMTVSKNALISGARKALKINSPSKEAENIGIQVGKGLTGGIKKSIPDASKAGKELAGSVVKSVRQSSRAQGPAPIGPNAPAGSTMLPIVSQPTKSDLRRTAVRNRLGSAKGMLSRGLGSASGMISGGLGGARGMGISSGLMMASQFMPGKAGEIAGQASGMAFAAQAGVQALKLLPGPAKLAAVGFLAVVGGIKLLNHFHEKNRQKVEAFGDAIVNTTEQTKYLADKFGFVAQENALQRFKNTTTVAAPQRAELESMKADPEFQKAYSKTINAVKMLSKAEARAALTFKSAELLSQGLPKETVEKIVTAIKEEAGKTEVEIDFAKITFDSAGLGGLAAQVAYTVRNTGKVISAGYEKIEAATREAWAYAGYVSEEELTKLTEDAVMQKFKKQINAAAASVASFSNTLANLAQNGKITYEQMRSSYTVMFAALGKQVGSTKAQLLIFKTAMSSIDKELGEAVTGVNSMTDAQYLLEAATAGVNTELLKSAAAAMIYFRSLETVVTEARALGKAGFTGPDQVINYQNAKRDADKKLELLKAETKAQLELQKQVNDAFNNLNKPPAGGGAGTGEKKFNLKEDLDAKVKGLEDQKKAYEKLTKAGIDLALAEELSQDAQIAHAIANGTLTQAMVDQINKYHELRGEIEKTTEANAKAREEAKKTVADKKKEILTAQEARFNLEEAIVQAKYAKGIEETNESLRKQEYALSLVNEQLVTQQEAMDNLVNPKQKRIDDIAYQLEGISFKEDAINEKYDRQSKLLSTISKMNQDLYSIQKKRVSLADALSSGDISAAASMIMEMRAEEASIQATSQQEVLDAAREQELNALGRLALEKESKKIQYEILTIQRSQSTALEDQAKAIQKVIDGLTSKLSDYENKAANELAAVSEKLSIAFGRTKSQIQSAMSMIDLANTAGWDMNSETLITNILDAALGKAEALKLLMKGITGVDTTTPVTPPPTTGNTPEALQKKVDEATAALKLAEEAQKIADKKYADYLAMKAYMPYSMVPDMTYPDAEPNKEAAAKALAAAKLALESAKTALEAAKKTSGTPTTGTTTPGTTNPPAATPPAAPKYGEYDPTIGGVLGDPAKSHGSLAGIVTGKDGKMYNSWTDGTWTPYVAPTTVPRGAAPATDEPAVVFPKEPATTTPTGPSKDPDATQDEANRERGGYQNTGTFSAAVVVGNYSESGLAAKLKNIPLALSSGGMVPKYFAKGGFNRGTDTVPAMLTPGEFVVNRRATAGLGINNLNKINNGEIPGGSVYNYKVDVTLNGSDMNPNDVANAVLTKIKQLESRNVRRQGI